MKLGEKVKEWNLLDKFRNKKVFALYLLGVLLLSGGVSYAFFTSRTESSGSGSIATGTTVELISEGLYADGNIGFNHTDIYPGHKAIASIRVIGTGQEKQPYMMSSLMERIPLLHLLITRFIKQPQILMLAIVVPKRQRLKDYQRCIMKNVLEAILIV